MEAVATQDKSSDLVNKINSVVKCKAVPRTFIREFGHIPNYTEWPELVGKSVHEAIETIWSDRPDVELWTLPITRKVNSLGASSRVIVYYDEYKIVTNPMPHIG